MMTFKTAKRMKDAGFPQPEPKFGQVWFTKIGIPVLVGSAQFNIVRDQELTYAPTSEDLLRELGYKWSLSWAREFYAEDSGSGQYFSHEISEEAMAIPWMIKNKA